MQTFTSGKKAIQCLTDKEENFTLGILIYCSPQISNTFFFPNWWVKAAEKDGTLYWTRASWLLLLGIAPDGFLGIQGCQGSLSEYCHFQMQLLPADHSCLLLSLFLIPPLVGIGFSPAASFPWHCIHCRAVVWQVAGITLCSVG